MAERELAYTAAVVETNFSNYSAWRCEPRARLSFIADTHHDVLKDTYDHSCCLARPDEYNHVLTDTPRRG